MTVLRVLREVANKMAAVPPGLELDKTTGMPFDEFAEMVFLIGLEARLPHEHRELVMKVVATLREETIDEIVFAATHNVGHVKPAPKKGELYLKIVNAIVCLTVCLDMSTMAISADYSPEGIGWLIVETLYCLVFVWEVATKMRLAGARSYLCGPAANWNLCDLAITVISVLEVMMNYAGRLLESSHDAGLAKVARVAVMLRGLRLIRVVRLVKLVTNPLLKDLANMLVGLVIGIPSLLWVMIFFVLILFMIGLTFRFMFGPDPGQNLISICGRPDDITDFSDPVCKVAWMYGEEFFGTLPAAMFTTFRFMLGDYSTRAGKSLVVALEQDYGMKFQLLFVVWMILAIFGLFNIITAIFVDTTVAGLKHNDVKRKYMKQYERRYVATKLRDLLARAKEILAEGGGLVRHHSFKNASHGDAVDNLGMIEMSEDDFVALMRDDTVKQLMADLDIEIFNASGIFFTFDGDGSGLLSLQELAMGVMKLRGDLQKSDMIASWMASRSLHDKFDALKEQLDRAVILPTASDFSPSPASKRSRTRHMGRALTTGAPRRGRSPSSGPY